ncbi:hypothetical protein B0H13DRAFT_2056002, partial [Mycena leptocephala]
VVFGSQMLVLSGCSFVAFLCMYAPFLLFPCSYFNCEQPRLVLIYDVNGNKMEKYYIFGAASSPGPAWYARPPMLAQRT